MRKYKLEINEKQARILRDAIDLYSRIGIGQFGEIWWVWLMNGMDNCKCGRDTFDPIMEQLKKKLTGFHFGASFGIHSADVNDVFRQAYDLKQVIRNRLAWDRHDEKHGKVDPDNHNRGEHNTWSVDFDPPRLTAVEHSPLAKIEKV